MLHRFCQVNIVVQHQPAFPHFPRHNISPRRGVNVSEETSTRFGVHLTPHQTSDAALDLVPLLGRRSLCGIA